MNIESLIKALEQELELCFEQEDTARLDEDDIGVSYWSGKARGLGTAIAALEAMIGKDNE